MRDFVLKKASVGAVVFCFLSPLIFCLSALGREPDLHIYRTLQLACEDALDFQVEAYAESFDAFGLPIKLDFKVGPWNWGLNRAEPAIWNARTARGKKLLVSIVGNKVILTDPLPSPNRAIQIVDLYEVPKLTHENKNSYARFFSENLTKLRRSERPLKSEAYWKHVSQAIYQGYLAGFDFLLNRPTGQRFRFKPLVDINRFVALDDETGIAISHAGVVRGTGSLMNSSVSALVQRLDGKLIRYEYPRSVLIPTLLKRWLDKARMGQIDWREFLMIHPFGNGNGHTYEIMEDVLKVAEGKLPVPRECMPFSSPLYRTDEEILEASIEAFKQCGDENLKRLNAYLSTD